MFLPSLCSRAKASFSSEHGSLVYTQTPFPSPLRAPTPMLLGILFNPYSIPEKKRLDCRWWKVSNSHVGTQGCALAMKVNAAPFLWLIFAVTEASLDLYLIWGSRSFEKLPPLCKSSKDSYDGIRLYVVWLAIPYDVLLLHNVCLTLHGPVSWVLELMWAVVSFWTCRVRLSGDCAKAFTT